MEGLGRCTDSIHLGTFASADFRVTSTLCCNTQASMVFQHLLHTASRRGETSHLWGTGYVVKTILIWFLHAPLPCLASVPSTSTLFTTATVHHGHSSLHERM
ncbi:hypothetical protein E2C01_026030 [Portunus trituberculatus]|uniref:Uncharacterized protein n=1 Tax=Portunus trituberculatus TaxID=210409 RepID=A0A5B7EJK3_PORTR|nr:hypothetical protein [Portunus trituberculatus]